LASQLKRNPLKKGGTHFLSKPPHLLLCWNTHPHDAGSFLCPSACSHLVEHTNYVLWEVFTSLKTEVQLHTFNTSRKDFSDETAIRLP
jgi:hypothetical protein